MGVKRVPWVIMCFVLLQLVHLCTHICSEVLRVYIVAILSVIKGVGKIAFSLHRNFDITFLYGTRSWSDASQANEMRASSFRR